MRTASRSPSGASTAATQYPGQANDAGSSIGTSPRLRPASHWRQKTFGSSPSGVGSCPARGRAQPRGSGKAGLRADHPEQRTRRRHRLPERYIPPTWPRSRRGSSDARSRSPTSRRSGSACSRTVTASAPAPETSRSSTRAASRTRRSRSRARRPRRPRGRTSASSSRAAPPTSRRRVRRPARQRPRRRRAAARSSPTPSRRRRRDRLRPGRSPARPGARVRQDPGRLLVLVLVLRDPARPWRHAEPLGRRSPRRDPAASRRRVTRRSCSPASISAASAIATRA